MFTVSARRAFSARALLVPKGGETRREVRHDYLLEAAVTGENLDDNGYLVDILRLEELLERAANYWRDKTLNEFPEFDGKNPTLEYFAKVACDRFADSLRDGRIEEVRVTLWESEIEPKPGPSASYSRKMHA